MNLNLILSKIGLDGNMSQDFSLLIIVVLLSLAFGTLIGKQRAIPVLLGTYISAMIVKNLPNDFAELYKLILFVVLIALFTIYGRKFLSGSLAFGSKLWKLFVFSFLEIMLIVSIAFSLISKSTALGFISASSYDYVVSGWFPFIWLVAPLIFLLMFCRRNNYSY